MPRQHPQTMRICCGFMLSSNCFRVYMQALIQPTILLTARPLFVQVMVLLLSPAVLIYFMLFLGGHISRGVRAHTREDVW